MRQAEDIAEIKNAIEKIDQMGEDWFTNLLDDDATINCWIQKRQISYHLGQSTLFLFRMRHDCQRCYFSTSKIQELENDFLECLKNTNSKIITSILDRNGMNANIKEILLSSGFRSYVKLNRVSMVNAPRTVKHQKINFAGMKDLPQIEKMIERYFDPLLDQHPDRDEIEKAIQSNRVIVARLPENGRVVAFQSFERRGRTLYGRYMVTMEEYRSQVPEGATLWRQCIKMNSDVNKVIGWIVDGNKATERWNRSVGLGLDGVTDEIFQFHRWE